MTRILVVDDDDAYRRVCRAVLVKAGHDVTLAPDGAKALRMLEQPGAGVDVVLTDILMPEKEGIETIMGIRRGHPKVKIIAMSGGGSLAAEECLAMSRRLGAAVVLRKPFSADQLLEAVTTALAGGQKGTPAPESAA